MGEHRLMQDSFFMTLYMKDKTSLKPPKALIKEIGWQDGDKIGVIIEDPTTFEEFHRVRSIRLINLTKRPEKEFEVLATQNTARLFSKKFIWKGHAGIILAHARTILVDPNAIKYHNKEIPKKRIIDAEKYLHEELKLKAKKSVKKEKGPYGPAIFSFIWIYDKNVPDKFSLVPLESIEYRYKYLMNNKKWNFQDFRKEHYVPREYVKVYSNIIKKRNKEGSKKEATK